MAEATRTPPNLTAVLLVIGSIVGAVWGWKHLDPDMQDAIIEHGVPVLALGAAGLVVVWGVWRRVQSRRLRRRQRERLLRLFERETGPERRRDLAFDLIELNDYRLDGLEAVAPAMRDLFLQTLRTQKGDKQHRVRGMAASHLGVLQDRSVVPALLAALDDDHAYVRSCAALGLGRLRAAEARDKLAKIKDEDWDQTVRSRAREALERIG